MAHWILSLLLLAGPALLSLAPASAAEQEAAAPDCADAIAASVQTRYDGVRDLAARFVQESRSVAFGGASPLQETRGRVWFAKPGRMRWEYEQPEPSLVVSDGEVLWIYDPAAQEAQRLAVDRGFLSATAIHFLLGEGRLQDSFEVRALECADGAAQLELRPLEAASYERIELAVDPATGWITETRVHDLFGNETRVAFSELVANAGVPAERFRFDPPENVRVLELPAASEVVP